MVDPFESYLMDGDGYVLTVRDETTINYLEHINMVSKEIVFVPPDFVAHLTAKSAFGRMGLSFLNSAKVHSGFVGRLALEIVNLNNNRKPITIRRSDPFMHFELISREGPPEPYHGRYMFQFMNDAEVARYMETIEANFSSAYRVGEIREVARARLTQSEELEP
ncbi:MAG: hypothetical protein JRN39_04920 [Nitrososphaerota archaeon]|nr:hypothetical protein [Nitrososphaerota archaeon]